MSRRFAAVLSICCIAALSVSAVAVAHGGSGDRDGKRSGHHGKRHAPTQLLNGGMFGAGLAGVAQRLDVAPADLRAAVKAVREEQWQKRLTAAGLTPEEIAALKACRHHGFQRSHHGDGDDDGASCDSAALMSAVEKLKAAPKPDRATLKTELATALAAKIGKTPEEVLAAVRAELDERLTRAVAAGWLTQKGHDLALACFDDPAACDVAALRAEVRWHGKRHGDNKRHGHRHHAHQRPGAAMRGA